jgi:hypothetical protein
MVDSVKIIIMFVVINECHKHSIFIPVQLKNKYRVMELVPFLAVFSVKTVFLIYDGGTQYVYRNKQPVKYRSL